MFDSNQACNYHKPYTFHTLLFIEAHHEERLQQPFFQINLSANVTPHCWYLDNITSSSDKSEQFQHYSWNGSEDLVDLRESEWFQCQLTYYQYYSQL